MTTKKGKSPYFTYKGMPLLRKGNLLYFGDLDADYIVCMQIEEKKQLGDTELATLVKVTLQTNEAPGRDRVIKKAERDGLYKAIDLSEFWLKEANKKS